MDECYHRRIEQLTPYLNNHRIRDCVSRAIENLKKGETEEREASVMDVEPVLKKLNEIRTMHGNSFLTKRRMVEYIVHEFLVQKQFSHLSENAYSLNGYNGAAYVFEFTVYGDVLVVLRRLPLHDRRPKTASSEFYEFPSLETTNQKKDEAIMKKIMRMLHFDLKRTWEHLNRCETPVSSTASFEDIQDFISS